MSHLVVTTVERSCLLRASAERQNHSKFLFSLGYFPRIIASFFTEVWCFSSSLFMVYPTHIYLQGSLNHCKCLSMYQLLTCKIIYYMHTTNVDAVCLLMHVHVRSGTRRPNRYMCFSGYCMHHFYTIFCWSIWNTVVSPLE
jgi:hypothetical protein